MSYKVAVLMGGSSFERDFSLASGRNVLRNLEASGHQVLPMDTGSSLVQTLRREQPDVAFIALHGSQGEDGTVQSLLEFLNIPFVGSPSSVCRLTWDKSNLPVMVTTFRRASGSTKAAHWPRGLSFSAAAFKDLGAASALDLLTEQLPSGYPYAVLPASGGSALGISKVTKPEDLAPALLEALSFDDEVLIEEWIDGTEIAVCLTGGAEDTKALPPVEIDSRTDFFNTEARLDPEFVDYYVPPRADSLVPGGDAEAVQAAREQIEAAAIEVHKAFGCRDLSRVDMIWDIKQQMPRVLEINVVPGMSAYSLFPAACEASGIGFGEILDQLLDRAVLRSH
ncbi:MAG: D-alanine--D-alanine ligase [Coriobacteriia bacterium]|nr:D-alanine--D-alanine ligase [Coriobacteriia bacterium]